MNVYVFLDTDFISGWSHIDNYPKPYTLNTVRRMNSNSYIIFPANLTIENVWKL